MSEEKKQTRKARRKVGRPEGAHNLADDILNAAERAFSRSGYAGTTLREVAEDLGVNSAMVAYYFQNKENLFRQVFLRRAQEIARLRMQNLAALHARGTFELRDVVRAFIQPAAHIYGDMQGKYFLKLHARIHMEPIALSFELRREVYDVSTRAYADTFLALMPDVEQTEIYRRISLLIGAYLYAFSGMSRLDELVPHGSEDTVDAMFETIVAFGTAGLGSR